MLYTTSNPEECAPCPLCRFNSREATNVPRRPDVVFRFGLGTGSVGLIHMPLGSKSCRLVRPGATGAVRRMKTTVVACMTYSIRLCIPTLGWEAKRTLRMVETTSQFGSFLLPSDLLVGDHVPITKRTSRVRNHSDAAPLGPARRPPMAEEEAAVDGRG